MLAALPLLSYVDRGVAAALLPRLDPAPLAEAIAAYQVPLSTHLAEAILDHADPVLCAALAAHVRSQFPADAPVDDLWEEIHDYGVPPPPPGRYERELPLVWPPRLLRRLGEAVPESAGWVERVGGARPWRAEWVDGWRIGADGPTGVPAHLTLPEGVRLPWPAAVLAAAWTDLLAYPEGRALSRLDAIMVVQRGVITGEFSAAQAVHEVRPASLALSPWWFPARLMLGRLRSAGLFRHRVLQAAVDGRVAVAGLLRRLGDDPGRWAALLARQRFAGTLPELVEEACARPLTGPVPADALLGWLLAFAPPGVVDELLDRCPDADLAGLAGARVRRDPLFRDAVIDRIAARAGAELAAVMPGRLPWLEHLLLAQGDPEVTAVVYRRADALLRAGILRGGFGGPAAPGGELRDSLLRAPTADDRVPMLASGDPDLVLRALSMRSQRAGATPELRREAYLTVAAARGPAAIAAAVEAAGDPDPGTVEDLARAVAADREELSQRLRREPDRDTLDTARRGYLDWDSVVAAHRSQPLPSLITRALAGRTDCTPAAYRALVAGADPGMVLPPAAGDRTTTLTQLATRPAPAFHDLLTVGGLSLTDVIRHVRPAARVLTPEGGDQDEVAIRAGVLTRQELGADPDRWLAAIRLLTEGFAGTLPELLAASLGTPVTTPAVAAALRSLPRDQADRLAELAVFPAGEDVPGVLVVLLWSATAGFTDSETRRLAEGFARRVLIDEYVLESGDIRLDPAVRDHLIEAAGPEGLARTCGALLDAAAGVADHWWALPEPHAFLLGQLTGLLERAGRRAELDGLVTDPRWLEVRLRRHGVPAVLADLARSGAPAAAALARAIERARPLLGPIEPAHALGAVLAGRLRDVPELRSIADAYAATLPTPRLASRWALPDHPHPALRRAVPTGSGVRSLAVAPDGAWVAAAGVDGAVRLWDVAGEFLAGYSGAATSVAIAPDGTWLASAGADGTVRLWDVTRRVFVGDVFAGHAGGAAAVAIAPDGTWLASAGADGAVRLWDVAARAEQSVFTGHAGGATGVAIAPDGASPAARSVLTGHAGGATGVAIAPDGAWLAASGADGTVRLWDVTAGTCRPLPAGHGKGATCVAIAPDGTWLATGGADGAVRLWDAATGAERTVLTGHRSAVHALGIAPDGSRIASAGNDNSVRLWDTATGTAITAELRHSGSAAAVAFAPDGGWLVSGGENDERLAFWQTGEAAAPYEQPRNAEAVAVSPDGTWLATVEGGTVPIRDSATGAERLRLARGMHEIAVAPGGDWIAAADHEVVRIYSTADGGVRATLPGHLSWACTVAVAPDGTWLATGDSGELGRSGYGTVRIWDATTGDLRHELKAHRDSVTRVVIAPDGTWLASAGHDGMVRIWDPATGALRAEWRARLHVVYGLAIAPDGTWLALGGTDTDVQILDTATGERRTVWRGRSGFVKAIAIAPGGDRVAVAVGDRIEIREAGHGRLLTAMRVGGQLQACAWLPDGRAVCAAGRSGTYLFDVVDA